LDFGKCAASRRSQKKTCRRFSTRFESASRKLGDAWGSAKGCRANLATAEGLTLPSPGDEADVIVIGEFEGLDLLAMTKAVSPRRMSAV
jgi:hypothetical protein